MSNAGSDLLPFEFGFPLLIKIVDYIIGKHSWKYWWRHICVLFTYV